MQTRNSLRAQLARAWERTIINQYNTQLINSERGLQTYFCAALLDEFKDKARRLFIEPKLTFPSLSSGRHPDIVICNTKQIVGIVEIKYVPRGRPSYVKDLETLRQAIDEPTELKLSNDRYRGIVSSNKSYALAKDAVLCWAGVYAGEEIRLHSSVKSSSLSARLLQLSALTAKYKDAKVVRRTK